MSKFDLAELERIEREVGCLSCYDCIHCRIRREVDFARREMWKLYKADPVAFDEETDRMFDALKRREDGK